jgi:CBS domain containing-hemolysin-like protein
MVLLLFYLSLVLIFSFLCSIMEAVLLSTPLSYLKAKEIKGNKSAKVLIELKQNIDKPISAIVSLNTIAHTVGAAGVGAQAVKVFGEMYFGIVSAILTILILVLTEIIPKTIGARYCRELSSIAGRMIKISVLVAYPLVVMSALITRFFSRHKRVRTTSREEIAVLAHIGAQEGIFGEKENKIIQNLIRLKNIRASEIMTPRVVVAVADEEMSLDEFLENKRYLRFSRIPVYSDNIENITGYVFRQTVFEKLAEDEEGLKLKDIKRQIIIAPETISLFDLWETLLETTEQIALIVNEYGGMEGIVTMEDVIESLLGFEIIDEKDTISDMRQYARERWKKRQAKYKLLEKHKGK